jgi:hypothetical protein
MIGGGGFLFSLLEMQIKENRGSNKNGIHIVVFFPTHLVFFT